MKNKILLLLLVIILSLSLLTACQSKAPSAAESREEATEAMKPDEQPHGGQKEPAKAAKQEQSATDSPKESSVEAPAKQKPTAPEKPAEVTSDSTVEPAEPKPDDKTSLQIEGTGIENPITLSLDELKAMTDAYFEDDFFSLNSFGTKEYFHFKGVKIKAILNKAVLKNNATAITFVASDGYKQEMTIEQALKENYIDEQDPNKKYPVIIAWHENGQDYNPEKGAPYRLVIGQIEPGDMNKPQWVQNISKIIVD